jgi:hypothetical protein
MNMAVNQLTSHGSAHRTPPTVTLRSPADGASYAQGATVRSSYACSDAGSGVASCAGTVASGAAIPTQSVGRHSFSVRARDKAGNEAGKTVYYTVKDITPPELRLAGKRTQKAGRRLTVILRARRAAVVTGQRTHRHRWDEAQLQAQALKRTKWRLVAHGAQAKLTLKVPTKALKAANRALRHERRVTAKLSVRARDAAGNATTRRRAVRLKLGR